MNTPKMTNLKNKGPIQVMKYLIYAHKLSDPGYIKTVSPNGLFLYK